MKGNCYGKHKNGRIKLSETPAKCDRYGYWREQAYTFLSSTMPDQILSQNLKI